MDVNEKTPGYVEIRVEVGHEAMEAVADFLVSEGAGGVAYDEDEQCTVTAYFRPDTARQVVERLRSHLAMLPEFGLDPGAARVSERFVPDADWANAWREYYHVRRIGKRLVIRPTWEAYDSQPGDVVIDMDPGMAFGTGEHATTELCLEALDELTRPGQVVADLGTGSGILAIAAAKLGASRVDAVDIDPEAVAVAEQNVRVNGVEDSVQIREGTVVALSSFGDVQYDLIVMNIIADVIIAALPDVLRFVGPRTQLIFSGIIDLRLDDVRKALAAAGLREYDTRQRGEWVLVRAGR